jgi:hypothetical protein
MHRTAAAMELAASFPEGDRLLNNSASPEWSFDLLQKIITSLHDTSRPLLDMALARPEMLLIHLLGLEVAIS